MGGQQKLCAVVATTQNVSNGDCDDAPRSYDSCTDADAEGAAERFYGREMP